MHISKGAWQKTPNNKLYDGTKPNIKVSKTLKIVLQEA